MVQTNVTVYLACIYPITLCKPWYIKLRLFKLSHLTERVLNLAQGIIQTNLTICKKTCGCSDTFTGCKTPMVLLILRFELSSSFVSSCYSRPYTSSNWVLLQDLPYLYGFVDTARSDPLAIGGPCDTVYMIGMAFVGEQEDSTGRVPYLHSAIPGT